MRRINVAVVLLAVCLGACATGKNFDTTRPLELDEGYRQDNQPLLLPDLEDKLTAHPVAGPQMSGYKAKKWTGLLLATTGGALVGWNVSDNLSKQGQKSWTLSLVGAGIAVASLPFALMADSQLHSAAEAYNGSLSQRQSSAPATTAVPFVSVAPASGGGKQYTAGLTMSF